MLEKVSDHGRKEIRERRSQQSISLGKSIIDHPPKTKFNTEKLWFFNKEAILVELCLCKDLGRRGWRQGNQFRGF